MPEELLDDLQGNALFQKVSGKAVAQGMRSDRFVDFGFSGGIDENFSEHALMQMSIPSFKEPLFRPISLKILA